MLVLMTLALRRWMVVLGSCPWLGCGPEPGSALEGRTFESVSVTEDGAPHVLVEGTRLELAFWPEGEIHATAGCNTISGPYSIDDGVFVLEEAAMTLIGCIPSTLHEQDDWYLGFLFSEPTLVLDGDSLVLESESVRVEYLDQEVATPDEALVGPTWAVDTVIEGDFAMHTEWPSPATLVFGVDGVVEVYTGCNGGSGTYSISGTELTFADVSVTERGCDSPTGELERAVLGLIHGPQPVTWEITVDRLSLRGDDVGLELVASDG